MRKKYERLMFTFERATSCKQEFFLLLSLQYLLHFVNVRRRCQQLASLKHYETMVMMNCVRVHARRCYYCYSLTKKLKYNKKQKRTNDNDENDCIENKCEKID